jgi:hypothetical protein
MWIVSLSWRMVGPALALVLALLATELPVVHAHDDGDVGLYNEECPLGRLATPPSAAVPDADPPATVLGPATDPPLISPALAPAARPLGSHAARAPPAPDLVPA